MHKINPQTYRNKRKSCAAYFNGSTPARSQGQ